MAKWLTTFMALTFYTTSLTAASKWQCYRMQQTICTSSALQTYASTVVLADSSDDYTCQQQPQHCWLIYCMKMGKKWNIGLKGLAVRKTLQAVVKGEYTAWMCSNTVCIVCMQ